MKKYKRFIPKFIKKVLEDENLLDEICTDAYGWESATNLFWEDNPSCLDDMFPDVWAEWICNEFIEHIENGHFDKEIKQFLIIFKKK